MEAKEGFKSWAIIEVMGHQVYCGFATDASIGGQSFLRVDVPEIDKQAAFTKYLGTGSIFSITPVDEATARAVGARRNTPPVDPYTIKEVARDLAQKMVERTKLTGPEIQYDSSQPTFGGLDQSDEDDDYDDVPL